MTLRPLVSLEEAWKAFDMDRNGVSDYWTADIAGMFHVPPSSRMADGAIVVGAGDPVDAAIAHADTTPWGSHPNPCAKPWKGYLYRALKGRVGGSGEKIDYGVRNRDHFGFCAYPAVYGSTGKQMFIVNESGKVWRRDSCGSPPPEYFPFDPRAAIWSPLD